MKLFHKMVRGLVAKAFSISDISSAEKYLLNGTSDSGEYISEHIAMSLSAVWACVNLIARQTASLPIDVYQTNAKGEKSQTKTHSLYTLLHKSPNSEQTAYEFWQFMAASLELWGNAYAKISRYNGKIVSLTPIQPAIMTVKRLQNGKIEYSWYDQGVAYKGNNQDILHLKGFGATPLGGMSTLAFARNTFGKTRSIDKAVSAIYKNGLRPSGAFSVDKPMQSGEITRLYDAINKQYAGVANTGKPMVLEFGAKWQQFSMTAEDAQLIESMRFSVEEICRFFGVPPHMIFHTEKSTSFGSGFEQQTLNFYISNLRPRIKNLEQAIAKQLFTARDYADGISIEFNMDALLRADTQTRSAFYASGLQNGYMTINEVRARENLPPVPGGDVPRMQMQNIPISEKVTPMPVGQK